MGHLQLLYNIVNHCQTWLTCLREGLQGGEGAARAGAGRVQNENSHLRVRGGSRGLSSVLSRAANEPSAPPGLLLVESAY